MLLLKHGHYVYILNVNYIIFYYVYCLDLFYSCYAIVFLLLLCIHMTVRYLGDQVDVEPASFLHQLTVAELLLGWF